jgi:hypothetical protein
MTHLLKSVTVKRYPVLHLVYQDGFSGDLDMSREIARGGMFEPLASEAFFAGVRLTDGGYAFGWRLDELGNELDFSADGARIDLETELVKKTAAEYRAKTQAAE